VTQQAVIVAMSLSKSKQHFCSQRLLTLLVGLFRTFKSFKNEWKGLFLLSKNFNAKTML